LSLGLVRKMTISVRVAWTSMWIYLK
jgi:hypothetical protein